MTALAVAAVLLGLAALAGIVLQGAAARGSGLGEAVSWDGVTAVLKRRFGKVWLFQAALACAVALLALAARRAPRRTWAPVLLAPIAALVPTPSLSGHASVSGNLSLLADLAHVAAASVWTGGLAFVVAALLVAGDQRWSLAADAVPRFSTLAVASVVVLLAAGVVSGYEEVGAWRGLWETTHGRLLLAKVALVLPLLALGAYNNRCAVPRLRRGIASPAERRRFLRMAEAELAIVLAIVGVTSVLVAEPPAGATIAPDRPVEAAGPAGLAPGASAALRSPPTRGARKPTDAWSLSCARFSKFVGPGASSVPAATHGSIQHLPEYPEVRLATPGQRRRALLLRSLLLAAARDGVWRDLRAAARAGYHTHTGRRGPGDRLVQYIHVERHQEPRTCGILNVRRPKALIYANAPGRPLVLVGAMWSTRVGERGPTPGGPITRWHYHVICSDEQRLPIDPTARGTCARGQQLRRGRNEMLHVWFTRDLRSTFAIRAPEPELCAADLLPKGYCRARFLVSR